MRAQKSTTVILLGAVFFGGGGGSLQAQAKSQEGRIAAAAVHPGSGIPRSGITAIVDVAVVPMDQERVLAEQTVLIEGGLITALGPASQISIPAGARQIDGRGKYLIPGLADMHLHLWGDSTSVERTLFLLVANGVTTVRVPNAFAFDSGRTDGKVDRYGRNPFGAFLLRLRARSRAGTLVSPRIALSGPWGPKQYIGGVRLRPKDDWPPPQLDSVAAYVAAYKAAGYDFIKIHDETPIMAESVAAAAHRVGIPVIGHIPISFLDPNLGLGGSARGVRWALQVGYTSIEHLYPYAVLSLFADSSDLAAVAADIQRAHIWVCPTLLADPYILHGAEPAQWPEVQQYVPTALLQEQERMAKEEDGGNDLSGPGKLRFIRALQVAGTGILSGTDASDVLSQSYLVPGFSLHRELAELVRAGLTPYQALVTSTRNVAMYFGTLNQSGTVTVGKRADLVLLEGNPLVDIQNTNRIVGVILGGRWLSHTALEQRLTADRPTWIATIFPKEEPVRGTLDHHP